MNHYFILGLFALLIVIVSSWRLMAEREFFRLTSMKKAWGRQRGLAMHFVCNVGLPLLVGIVFLSQGVVDFSPGSVENSPGSGQTLNLHAVAQIQARPGRQPLPEHWGADFGLCP